MAGPRGNYQYLSDDGNAYRIKMDAGNAVAVGNAVHTSGGPLPSGYIPRYILARHPTTGQSRELIVCDPANPLFVGGDTSITIESFATSPSSQVAHSVDSRIGEKRYNR